MKYFVTWMVFFQVAIGAPVERTFDPVTQTWERVCQTQMDSVERHVQFTTHFDTKEQADSAIDRLHSDPRS